MNNYLSVYLTTSEFTSPDTSTESIEEILDTIEGSVEFKALKVPIIHAEYKLPHFESDEHSDHLSALECLEMTKEVEVDLNHHVINIAGDLDDDSTYLLNYQGCNNIFEKEFFCRYEQAHGFTFNFVVYNGDKIMFVLRGIYIDNKWAVIETQPTSNIRAICQ